MASEENSPAQCGSVHEAIQLLLAARQPATPDTISRLTGKSYADVLAVLARNAAMLVFNGDGRVTGSKEREESLAQAFNHGKTFRYKYDPYGHGPYLEFAHNSLWDRLAKPTDMGGMMDWWQEDAVNATPENLSTLRAAGMVPEDEFDWQANSPWREED